MTWPASSEKVMKIELKGFDQAGFFKGVTLHPWRFDVPHREMIFETGKWEIQPQEKEKLDESFQKIADSVRKHGQFAKVRLFVVGHTDTVASTQSNLELSMRRAKSIGSYFRSRGIRVPLLYAGYGETALAVQTADEVDEPRNRRAEYIISIDEPEVAHATTRAAWHGL